MNGSCLPHLGFLGTSDGARADSMIIMKVITMGPVGPSLPAKPSGVHQIAINTDLQVISTNLS